MKSDYSKESITEFLSRKYGEDIRLFPIKEGQESQAYWFSRGGREYVVRINSNMEGFKKTNTPMSTSARIEFLFQRLLKQATLTARTTSASA